MCSLVQNEWEEINKFMENIEANNYKSQSDLSYKHLIHNESNNVPCFESNIIKFAGRMTLNTYKYTSLYLNRLIHGLLKVSKTIYDS